jgi:hypothetical protein
MNNPDHMSWSLETILWVKKLKFFDANPGSRMEKFGSGMPDGKKSDPGSGVNIPDPQHYSQTISTDEERDIGVTNKKPAVKCSRAADRAMAVQNIARMTEGAGRTWCTAPSRRLIDTYCDRCGPPYSVLWNRNRKRDFLPYGTGKGTVTCQKVGTGTVIKWYRYRYHKDFTNVQYTIFCLISFI